MKIMSVCCCNPPRSNPNQSQSNVSFGFQRPWARLAPSLKTGEAVLNEAKVVVAEIDLKANFGTKIEGLRVDGWGIHQQKEPIHHFTNRGGRIWSPNAPTGEDKQYLSVTIYDGNIKWLKAHIYGDTIEDMRRGLVDCVKAVKAKDPRLVYINN